MIDIAKSEMSSACLQGGSLLPVPGYQSTAMMGPQSPHSAWQFSSTLVKQEPITGGDKNDSGINSGSDFHSSSPGSDTSGQYMHTAYSGSNKSDNDTDEQGLRVPKFNSHGKIKKFKCKQCDFVAITKVDFWEHSKIHIKEDKCLTCPKCPFVTEYKHHLEYHLRNHQGSKPFKCTECNYECVNKGMLSSHMKSHSNIYPYRCADCSYATKYCHSLKLHLRKYTHTQAVVLNPDGTPNPQQVIDVYGTRRGPKLKTQQSFKTTYDSPAPSQESLLPFPMNQLLPNPFPFLNGFPGAIPNPQLLQNIQRILSQRRESYEETEEPKQESGVLDLSKPDLSGETSKNRRKGRAYKLDSLAMNSDEEDDEMTTTVFGNVEVVEDKEDTDEEECDKDETMVEKNNNVKSDNNTCQYCNISFNDPILYTLHMGYHGYKNPFTCNMCGVESTDKITFFLHITRMSHT